jgi:hypothetical protein
MAHDHDALRRALKQSGGVDGLKVIDGPRLEGFTPDGLARALELEIARSRTEGWPKINISLDLEDAWALMKFLRRN